MSWRRARLGSVLLLLLFGAGLVVVARRGRAELRFHYEIDVGYQNEADAGPAGLALLVKKGLFRVGKDGALRPELSPLRGCPSAVSIDTHGDVSFLFHRPLDIDPTELRAARIQRGGKLLFDVGLEQGHARCYFDMQPIKRARPEVATADGLTWVALTGSAKELVALDQTGREVRSFQPCECWGKPRCDCFIDGLFAHAEGIAVRLHHGAAESLDWFDRDGKLVRGG
ncbi:MAG TPA: hypothetical protein VNG33_15760 [Polyangiaceae bacterium]|nr:hypothetical protein [Polyangiaceae bacterium]